MNLRQVLLLTSGLMMATSVSADTQLNTEADKFSYGLGMMIGERVLKQYGEVDYDILLEGIKAQHQDGQTLMTIEEAGQALSSYQQKGNQEKYAKVVADGIAYMEKNAIADGVSVTKSGLQYSVITAGDGAKPKATDTVTVHYRGTLLNGKEFDSSYSRGTPASFGLNQVIPGWTEGVQLMNTGSKYKFVIPYQLAYGERGAGSSIGPYETLIFEVELIGIQ